jgi:hypothetical protein
VLRVEDAQRFVVLLFIEQDSREPQPCDLLELVFGGLVDHPRELRLGAGCIAALVQLRRSDQCGAGRIAGAPYLSASCAIASFVFAASLARAARYRIVEHACLRRLLLRPPPPALHGDDAERQRDDDSGDGVSPLLPPRLQVFELVLLFEIVSGHRESYCCPPRALGRARSRVRSSARPARAAA